MSAPDVNDHLRATGAVPDPFDDTAPMADPTAPAPVVDLDVDAPAVGALADEAFDRMRRRASGAERPLPLPCCIAHPNQSTSAHLK